MSQIVGINSSTALVQYNQAASSLAYSYSVPINQLNPNSRGGKTSDSEAQPVQPNQGSSGGQSYYSALSAGLLVPNPRSLSNSETYPLNPTDPAETVSPLVPLGVASQAVSTGETIQYYNAANLFDKLNVNSIYAPTTPVYDFPPAYLDNSYNTNVRLTPPSTVSSDYSTSVRQSVGRDYGYA